MCPKCQSKDGFEFRAIFSDPETGYCDDYAQCKACGERFSVDDIDRENEERPLEERLDALIEKADKLRQAHDVMAQALKLIRDTTALGGDYAYALGKCQGLAMAALGWEVKF